MPGGLEGALWRRMQRQRMQRRDGKTFRLEGDAKHHAEECYGAKITEIANKLRDDFTFGDAAEGIGHYTYIIRDLEKLHALFAEAVALKEDRKLEEDND